LNNEKVKVILYSTLPDFRESTAFLKVPRLGRFVLLIRAACR